MWESILSYICSAAFPDQICDISSSLSAYHNNDSDAMLIIRLAYMFLANRSGTLYSMPPLDCW